VKIRGYPWTFILLGEPLGFRHILRLLVLLRKPFFGMTKGQLPESVLLQHTVDNIGKF